MRIHLRFISLFVCIFLLALFLRIFRVADTPHDLYIDEVSIGYSAYSILTSGADEYGAVFPAVFRSLDDYKLPGYIYLVSLSQLVFGKNSFSLRFPSVASGVITVVFFVQLLRVLSVPRKYSLLAGYLLAVSSWHIQFSRAGFEVNTAVCFLVIGSFYLVYTIQKKKGFPFAACFFFVLALYTYHTVKLFLPVFLAGLFVLYRKQFVSILCNRKSITSAILFALLIIPFLRFSFSSAGLIRLRTESFIKDVKREPDNFFSSFTYLASEKWVKNYIRYFSLDFLFFAGDAIGRHSVREIGQNYVWMLPFFVWGVYGGIKKREKRDLFFIFWYLSGGVPAAFVLPNPHALRTLVLVIPVTYFSVMGISDIISKFQAPRSKQIPSLLSGRFRIWDLGFRILIVFVCTYFFFSYLHIYYVHYPKITDPDWSGGYKETIDEIGKRQKDYPSVYLTKNMVRGYIYLYYYADFNPKDLVPIDYYSNGYSKFRFVESPFNPNTVEKLLYVSPSWEVWKQGKLLKKIYNRGNDWVFSIWEN